MFCLSHVKLFANHTVAPCVACSTEHDCLRRGGHAGMLGLVATPPNLKCFTIVPPLFVQQCPLLWQLLTGSVRGELGGNNPMAFCDPACIFVLTRT